MKRLLFLCTLLFTISINAYTDPETTADKTGFITGKVLDATLNEPLPYVNIILKNSDGTTLTGTITLEDGTFKLDKVEEGKYIVSIQYIGYRTQAITLTIGKGNYKIELGNIYLSESAENLDEVTVVAEVSTIQQKVDRKVVTIGKDLAAIGTASEIMASVPSVNVDAQTGDISLRGNQNVRVMVDGKLSNIPAAQLLKQIPSTSIKQIELITNPSAKYNPEGMSGIINIVLHKNTKLGFNGNLSVGLGYEIEPKFNSAVDFNYRNGKFNFFGNYSNNISKNINEGTITQIENRNTQLLNILEKRKSHLIKSGIDFYLNDKNTISVFTSQNIYDGGVDFVTNLTDSNHSLNNLNQTLIANADNKTSQYNFDYKLEFDKNGHNIELEIDHNMYDENSNNINTFFGNTNRPNYLEFTDTERDRTTINLDYVNPLTENSKLELGAQALLFDNGINYSSDGRVRNQMGDYIPTSTTFNYKRDIYAAYINYGKNFDKWSYQIGLRGETVKENSLAVDTDLNSNVETLFPFKNDYVQVYPSAFFTYSPSDKNTYQLSYSRRVDRPGVGQVNPIPEWTSPLVSQFGNQELQPQFTNSLEINYTKKLEKGSITTGVFYRVIEDEINQAVFIDRTDLSSNRVILTNGNFDNTTAYGIELSSSYKPFKWWSVNASFDFYSQTQKGITESIDPNINNPIESDIVVQTTEVDNVIWNLRAFNNFRVNNKLAFTAFGMYRSKTKGLQFELDPIYLVNLGMRYAFLEDNRAMFSLNFNNVFDTQEIQINVNQPFKQTAEFNREFNTIYAGLSYRFGGGKYRAKSRKNRDNNEKSGGGFL